MATVKMAFPLVLIALDAMAGMVFAWCRDYVSCGYWICAAGISSFALLKQIGF